MESEGGGKRTWSAEILLGDDVFSLRNVDYSEKGMAQEIIVEGRRKRQTVIYSALDYSGEKWYYNKSWKTERDAEGHALDREKELQYNLEHIFNGR